MCGDVVYGACFRYVPESDTWILIGETVGYPKYLAPASDHTDAFGFAMTKAAGSDFGEGALPLQRTQVRFLRPQYQPKNRPAVPFEKDTCINFQFWTFRATFWDAFATVVALLIR